MQNMSCIIHSHEYSYSSREFRCMYFHANVYLTLDSRVDKSMHISLLYKQENNDREVARLMVGSSEFHVKVAL